MFENGDRHKNILRRAFEKVYAVFDRNNRDSYFDALRLAESLDDKVRNDAKQPIVFQTIASVPSFELWLLLQYEDIQAPLHRDGVMCRLKLHISSNEKGVGKAFASTNKHLAIASERAERLAARFTANTGPEPFAAIVRLVASLTTLRSRRAS